MSVMRVNSQELPLYAIPLCQLLQCHLGLPGPPFPSTWRSKAVSTAPLERSTCPYQRSHLFFRMRSRFSMPSHVSSSLDLVVTVSCGLTVQICLIIALSFRCRHWLCQWPSLTGMEHCALHTRAVYVATCLEREVAGREKQLLELLSGSFQLCCG